MSVNFLSANAMWKMKILTSLHSAFSIQGYQSFKCSEPSFGRNVSKQSDTAVANNWIFFQIESAFASNLSRERPACDTRATEETLENTQNSALFLSISTYWIKYSLGIHCESSQWEDMKFLNTFVCNFSAGAKCRLFMLGKYEIFFRPLVFMSHPWHCKCIPVTR